MAGSVSFDDARFDVETDVVVAGAGACGLTAAIAARAGGADVVVLERDAAPTGSTTMSQGYVCAAGTRMQREAGIEDSPERFYADVMARTKGTADPVVAAAVTRHAGGTIDWLKESFDVPFAISPNWAGFFGHSVNRMHGMPTRTGTELLGSLQRAVTGHGADLVTEARVETVYASPEGLVRGVAVVRPDGSQELIACKALVAATCGFGANRELVRRFIPAFGNAANYRYFGHEGNEGHAIGWGEALGARLGSMDAFQGYGALAEQYGIVGNYDMIMGGGIAVNINGERFSNEVADVSGQALNVLSQPGGIAWIVFDDWRHELCKAMPEYRQLTELGAFRIASSVDELTGAIGVPAAALTATLQSVEQAALGQKACPFGRDFSKRPPLQPRYRALRVTGALFHTQGGLQVDAAARVVRTDGQPIVNFFAGGGAARSISGDGVSGYLPAAGLCTAITLGRLAGAGAADWSRSPLAAKRG